MKHIYLFSVIACALLFASCEIKTVPPTGDIAGYNYVDLGLSVYWATANLAAGQPEIAGDQFQWGETENTRYNPISEYDHRDKDNRYTKYCSDSKNGNVDNLKELQIEDDAANTYMGNDWRTPTLGEWEELVKRCRISKTTLNNVEGLKVTGPNGNYIFLPKKDNRTDLRYMSTTLFNDAACSFFDTSKQYKTYLSNSWRTETYVIRPVHNK